MTDVDCFTLVLAALRLFALKHMLSDLSPAGWARAHVWHVCGGWRAPLCVCVLGAQGGVFMSPPGVPHFLSPGAQLRV